MTWYCRPEAVVTTPGFLLFSARKAVWASRFFLLCAAISSCCLACILSEKVCMISMPCSWVSKGSLPFNMSSIARLMVAESISPFIGSSDLPMSMPIM